MSGLFLKGPAFGFLLAQALWIGLGGAAFLVWLGVKTLRARLDARLLRGINLVSGATILGFAAWQIARLLR